MTPRIEFVLLVTAVIATAAGAWFGHGTNQAGCIDTVSAQQARAICGAGCYDPNFGAQCSDACGRENGWVGGASNKDGIKLKDHQCNDSNEADCKKPNWKDVNCLGGL